VLDTSIHANYLLDGKYRLNQRAIEDEILEHYGSLMRHVADWHASEFLGVDMTMSQAKVLYVASVRPGIGMSALAAELGVGLSAVSGLVDRLVAVGYLERREEPSDRRQQLVALTATGADALDRLRELRAELMRRLMAGLDAAELAALRDALAALDREARHLGPAHSANPSRPERTPA
jgi:DNA-binding MarR family transcriptional regulator